MEHDELAQHLESLRRESCYRVDAVLKQSAVEVTQRVFFAGSNGAESGPYIRKFIKQGFGVGAVYERIYSAQQRGHRFKYIPDVLECYARDDELVVVMELVQGQTLQDAVYERDPSVQLAREIFPKLCDAVSELHCEFDPPIIHRDLKPSNIILTGEGLALIDFGISREYDEDASADTTHFGTREFAPPEQYGFGQTGVYSDIYSLGMVLYFCLTELIPNAQTRKQAFSHEGIPEPLRRVVERAVALDPAARYASAQELKEAFLAAASEIGHAQRQTAASVSYGQKTNSHPSHPKRTRSIVAFGIAAIACLALVAVFFLGTEKNPTDSAAPSNQAVEQAASTNEDSPESVSQPTAEETASTASSSDADANATPEQIELAMSLGNQAQPKDGFDPATNFTADAAEVEFQVPTYFGSKTSIGSDGEHYYYAETGSSVVMIMTKETFISEDAGRAEFESSKDDYLSGLMESEVFDEITASTDYELAGFPARVVSISGAVKGIPATYKATFFFNSDIHKVGVIIFGQTANAQFDYSLDFAKVITSAKRQSN